jgi:L-ribulose-5-phosphate 3-epimerase UlaE
MANQVIVLEIFKGTVQRDSSSFFLHTWIGLGLADFLKSNKMFKNLNYYLIIFIESVIQILPLIFT